MHLYNGTCTLWVRIKLYFIGTYVLYWYSTCTLCREVCVSVALTAFVLCHFFVFVCGIFLFCFLCVYLFVTSEPTTCTCIP